MRDLSAGEIVEQVRLIKKDNNIASNRRLNIVYMGMGEPLDNLEEGLQSSILKIIFPRTPWNWEIGPNNPPK